MALSWKGSEGNTSAGSNPVTSALTNLVLAFIKLKLCLYRWGTAPYGPEDTATYDRVGQLVGPWGS